jgi:tRNA threonylcarbamoyladenosine biosynthesis protein TsaE
LTILETRSQVWADEAACAASARALATHAGLSNACIELDGPLGAGKTTFVRHLLHALGVAGRVKSPTYALMEPYALARAAAPPLQVWHFDFYRFNDPQEWEDAGFRDVFASEGLKITEWARNAHGLLPRADLRIELEPLAGEGRRARWNALTPRGVGLLA